MATAPKILFHWKAPKSEFAQRWIVALIVAIIVHGFCFYVFQIEEVPPPRSLAQTYGVTQLNFDDLKARLILQQIDDYYAAFEGILLADTPLHMPLGSLDYEASYEKADVELMPLPEPSETPLDELGPTLPPMVLPPIATWDSDGFRPEAANGESNAVSPVDLEENAEDGSPPAKDP